MEPERKGDMDTRERTLGTGWEGGTGDQNSDQRSQVVKVYVPRENIHNIHRTFLLEKK